MNDLQEWGRHKPRDIMLRYNYNATPKHGQRLARVDHSVRGEWKSLPPRPKKRRKSD